ncbi:MAG: hypothetical protein ACTSYS_11060, partial [Promethearchaeota archaeon]
MEFQDKRLKRKVFFIFLLLTSLQVTQFKNGNFLGHDPRTIKGNIKNKSIGEEFFHTFSPSIVNDQFPTCSIYFNLNESYIFINGSESFYFTRDGGITNWQVKMQNDDFLDGTIQDFWIKLNENNGSFLENNGIMKMNDSGFHQYFNDINQAPKKDAPALVQQVNGDFNASVNINITALKNKGGQAGLIFISGQNFVFFSYHHEISSGKGFIEIFFNDKTNGLMIEQKEINATNQVFLQMNRTDMYFGFDFNDQLNESLMLNEKEIFIDPFGYIGFFTAENGSAEFFDWNITPRVNITLFDQRSGLIKAIGVPLIQYDENNIVRFSIDTNATTFLSSEYQVRVDTSNGSVKFTDFAPTTTTDKTPNINIFLDSKTLGVNASDVYSESCKFAYSVDGKKPEKFINPHNDNFMYYPVVPNATLPRYWDKINPENLDYKIENNDLLYFSDKNNSNWNAITKSAPAITQDLFGDFQAIAKFRPALGNNSNGGMILIFNDSDSILFTIHEQETSWNVSTFKITNNSHELKNSDLVGLDVMEDALWLKIKNENNTFTFSYSTTGDSYNIYQEIYSIPIHVEKIFKVGLVGLNNSTTVIDYWDITPSWYFHMPSMASPQYAISISEIPFNQVSDTDNCLRALIVDVNNITSASNVYYPNITISSIGNEKFLFSDNEYIRFESRQGRVVQMIYNPNTLDAEILPSGNILASAGRPGSGNVRILDESGIIIREITSVSGIPLIWPHDADMLANGNILIADTGNDRAIEINENNEVT